MHLSIVESKNSKSLYVIRSTYKNGRNSSERVEKLGTYAETAKTRSPGLKPILPILMKRGKRETPGTPIYNGFQAFLALASVKLGNISPFNVNY